VNETVHDRLSAHFNVKYLIGVCGADFASGGESMGRLNTWITREDFNRVQLNDRAEVRITNHRFDVIDIYTDVYTVESTDVHTFDFTEFHKDDGISSDEC
jgi:hypothetical protein